MHDLTGAVCQGVVDEREHELRPGLSAAWPSSFSILTSSAESRPCLTRARHSGWPEAVVVRLQDSRLGNRVLRDQRVHAGRELVAGLQALLRARPDHVTHHATRPRASWCRYRSPERPLRCQNWDCHGVRRETDHGPHRRVYEGDGRRRTMPAEGKACPSASSRPPGGHRPVGRLTPACPAAALGGRPVAASWCRLVNTRIAAPVTASEGRFLGLGVPRRDPLPAVKAWAESRALDPIAIELGRDRLRPPAPSPPGGRAAGAPPQKRVRRSCTRLVARSSAASRATSSGG